METRRNIEPSCGSNCLVASIARESIVRALCVIRGWLVGDDPLYLSQFPRTAGPREPQDHVVVGRVLETSDHESASVILRKYLKGLFRLCPADGNKRLSE